MKRNWVFTLVGAVALALAAAGVLRELSGPAGPAGPDSRAGPVVARSVLPEVRFIDGSGRSRSLAEFRGRVILLNLWATWCAPCREEMPSLDRLQQTLGGTDFEVVALSIDRGGILAVEVFYEELDLRALRAYVDPSTEALARVGAVGIPTSVLIDRNGRELWRVVGPVRWDDPQVVARIRGYLDLPRDS